MPYRADLAVHECFSSIQGEGLYAGVPTVFIRLQGCNLRCLWCDTKYAQETKLPDLNIDTVVARAEDLVSANATEGEKWVCITGGEPLIQANRLGILVVCLKQKGFKVEVETNGTQPRPTWWADVDSWVVDIKCPSSGTDTHMGLLTTWVNTRPEDQIKFVVGDYDDLKFVESIITDTQGLRKPFTPAVLISPVIGRSFTIHHPWLPEVVHFCKKWNLRFSLQVHKVIWDPQLRGV